MKLSLAPRGPFDFYQGLKDITRAPFGLTEQLENNQYLTVLFDRLVTIQQEKKDGNLIVEFNDGNPSINQKIAEEITRRFGLLQDLEAFYGFAGGNRKLIPIIHKLRGLTMFQKSSPFEALVTAIADQQLNVSFATTLKRRLILTYGRKFKSHGLELWTFPTCNTLAKLEDGALRPLQYSNSKSRFIIHLAKGIVAGNYPLEEWSLLDDRDLIQSLMSIYGVGQWTAEYVAMVGYNRCDVIPAADIGLQRAVQLCYELSDRPGENEVRAIAKRWSPWRGLVTYYLWHAFE